MKPFLYQVASLFYGRYGREISRLAFVFPNRRAGLFFQKYLSEIAGMPLFSPTILTINDLFLQLSGMQQADRMKMLFRLYELYKTRSGSDESFDDFLYWGEMLLNDFDDVDKYRVDARMLFANVTDLREMEQDFSYLTPEQVAAIRTFWSSFSPEGKSENQKQFLALWQILYDLYVDLRRVLADENCGYEGMIFREVVERLERNEGGDLPYEKVVFVGLNALSVTEECLLSQLHRRGIADFYWDYASPLVRDRDNKASYFVERNLERFPSAWPLPQEEEERERQIEVVGIPSGIGQDKQVYRILDAWCDEYEMDAEGALRTAVILPDEQLLIPVLNAIPERIRRINVTMGYPLSATPIASLVEYVLALQKNLRYVDAQPAFYFRDVLPILNHRYVMSTAAGQIGEVVKDISENNRIYIPSGSLTQTPLLTVLFTPVKDVESVSDYLIAVLQALNRVMTDREEVEEEERPVTQTEVEREFIYHYFVTVNRMKEMMRETGVEMRLDTYFRLLKRMTDTITIPFHGEPLSGLQIMGVLETRALDFDRLIILSMNEGVFPQRRVANSFIPYNLRRGFGLPTYEHQDSIWAYHFYRLIHRASQVSLLYDTRSNGLQTGEVSRFVYQLRYHYEVPMRDKLVVYNVSSSQVPVLQMEKTATVMELLNAFRKGGARALSASALNTYLDCPLQFYFAVVEGIEEEDEVSETVESNVFGSILHKVMENVYRPFCGQQITAELLKAVREDVLTMTGAVARAFAEVFFKTDVVRPLTGQNFLIGEMIRKYATKILERDGALAPFRYLESEKKVRGLFSLSDGSEVQLKGFIDRVDEVGGTLRIIDYKSGTGMTVFPSVEALFDKSAADRPKAVMQVFMYAWMYANELSGRTAIQPGIYYVRTLFAPTFDAGIYRRVERGKQERVMDFADYRDAFEEGLRGCLDEIFSEETPFIQTTNGKACSYCRFRSICGK